MYQKIMVPLDGSKLAECVLPYVEALAKGCNTEEVILVSVTELIIGIKDRTDYNTPVPALPSPEPVTRVPITIGKKQRQSERYLSRIAKQLGKKKIKVRTATLVGNPAHEITLYAEQNNCDLIAMASHGRSGLSRWAFGSIADKVFRASSIPVLMVKCPGSAPGK